MKTYVATYSRVPGGKKYTFQMKAKDFLDAVQCIVDCSSDLGPEIVAIWELPEQISSGNESES